MSSSKRQASFYFGGMPSCVAAVVVHPLDLTKVRLQNMKGNGKGGRLGTMIKIARTEDPLRLYARLSASVLHQATYSTVQFGVYKEFKHNSTSASNTHGVTTHLLYSSAASALGGACGNLGDMVNVRMQNGGLLLLHQCRNYKAPADGLVRISREEGLKALFRGVGVTSMGYPNDLIPMCVLRYLQRLAPSPLTPARWLDRSFHSQRPCCKSR